MISTEDLDVLQRIALQTPVSELGRVVAHDTILLAIMQLEKRRPQDSSALLVLDEMLMSLKEPRRHLADARVELPVNREYAVQVLFERPDTYLFVMDASNRSFDTPVLYPTLEDAQEAARIWEVGATRIMTRTVSTSDWSRAE